MGVLAMPFGEAVPVITVSSPPNYGDIGELGAILPATEDLADS
jgi:hypothetical protein